MFCHCSCDWWYCHNFIIMLIVLADVMPGGDVPLIVIVAFGQLSHSMADVIAMSWMLMFGRCQGGRWNAHHGCDLADVVAKVADGIATGSMF